MFGVGRKTRDAIGRLLSDLAAGRYDEVVADGRSGAIAMKGLLVTLEQHGCRIDPQAPEAVAHLRLRRRGFPSRECVVEVPLMTLNGSVRVVLVIDVRRSSSMVQVLISDLEVLT